MVIVTRSHLDRIFTLNAQSGYPDAEAVYQTRKHFHGEEHQHYWSFRGNEGRICCFICDKEWEDHDES